MQNALIYSPSFDGHRQVYIFVLAHVLQELNFKIFIAGNNKQIISNSFFIDKLKNNPYIRIIDTSKYADGGYNITASEFLELQHQLDADLTIFAEADDHIPLFNSQFFGNKKKFKGRLIGIFLRPFYYYQKGLFNKLRYLKHLPSRWSKDDRLFHEFFLERFSLLDGALCIDENFVTNHKFFKWLPDVFQQYADSLDSDEKSEQRVWISKLNEFKDYNKGKFFFFYFGNSQLRRGYDLLLKMAVDRGDCFIHCGLRNSDETSIYNIDELRSTLDRSGRLFETNQFIEDPVCIESFFKSNSHLILPYRNFLGSSGVMLQALNYGIPILAPDNGIIGYRINKFQLGLTYNEKDPLSFNRTFDIFIEQNPKKFENTISNYMKSQSIDQLKTVLVDAFIGNVEQVKQS